LFVFAVVLSAAVSAKRVYVPQQLPCGVHLTFTVTETGVPTKTQNFYVVNKKYIKYVVESTAGTEYRLMRKDGNTVTEHFVSGTGTSARCVSNTVTEAELANFYDVYMNQFSPMNCDDITVQSATYTTFNMLCHMYGSNGDTTIYTYDPLGYLKKIEQIGRRNVTTSISYDISNTPAPSIFVVPSDVQGCDSVAYSEPSASECFCPKVKMTPHQLPCHYRITIQSKENGSSITENVYVHNKNHIKYVLQSTAANETRVLRKEGNKIKEYSVTGLSEVCMTRPKTQADFDDFYNSYLSPFFTTVECDKVTDLSNRGKRCRVERSNGDVYEYDFSSDFHLTRISQTGSRTVEKTISYRHAARPEDFVVPNNYRGCEAVAYTAPTVGLCYRPVFTPHDLPCEFHIFEDVTHELGSCELYENHYYMNKNYRSYYHNCRRSIVSYHEMFLMRKDGDNITHHTYYSMGGCLSEQSNQTELDNFLISSLRPYLAPLDCDSIVYWYLVDNDYYLKNTYENISTGGRVCERLEDDGYMYRYIYDSDNYITSIVRVGQRPIRKTVTYNFTVPSSAFVLDSGNCDPIAYVEPTEGFCTASDDTTTPTTPEQLDEWEIHIDFEGLDVDASLLNSTDILLLVYRMSGVDVSKMRIDVDVDANGKVSGVTLYVSGDEDVATGVLNVVNECKSESSASQCLGIFQFVKSASVEKSGAFTEGGNSIKVSSIIAVMSLMMTIILYFSR